ncbi:unnamed protein product [Alopecurus aequalis]
MDTGGHRGSPAKLETCDHSAKKQRLDGPVKQETVAAGAIVPAEHGPRMEVAMKMDVTVLHCPICLRPFKPPVMQCKRGHLACGGCCHDGAPCGSCGAAFDVPNTAMDDVVSAARVQCPHDGCETYVAYHGVQDHQSACPHAPCWCTEAGCGFVGLAPALVAHLAAAHAVPVNMVPYCKAQHIQVTVPEPSSRLLVGAGDEGGAFLLSSHSLGAATVITAVCIRAEACPWPRYTVKMWANGPRKAAPAANRKTDNMMTEFEATSSTTPGAVSLEDLTSYLMVPPGYLVGAGPSKELSLNIRIERTTS